jgi:hypothetical protein
MTDERMADHERPNAFEATQEPHAPRGGVWALFATLSLGFIPLTAIAPESWKIPLAIVSLVFLALTLFALMRSARWERSGRQTHAKGHLPGRKAPREEIVKSNV